MDGADVYSSRIVLGERAVGSPIRGQHQGFVENTRRRGPGFWKGAEKYNEIQRTAGKISNDLPGKAAEKPLAGFRKYGGFKFYKWQQEAFRVRERWGFSANQINGNWRGKR